MGKLFGTDGIRGLANRNPITPEVGLRLGGAVTLFCKRNGITPSAVIGRDTRASGEMLEYAIISGIQSAGGNVFRAGELPTPGVSYLTRNLGAGCGIVISASHNPHDYNGFKVFSNEGFKLSEEEEAEIEEMILSEGGRQPEEAPGKVEIIQDAVERYVTFLRKTIIDRNSLKEMKLVIDCANGATSNVAPALFKELAPQTKVLFASPDGKNINQHCGSQHTETLRDKVIEFGADVGLAFDGDGDRLIAVDEKGTTLTGDQILAICAVDLKEKGQLTSNLVVSTVMSNIGFKLALQNLGIDQLSTKVGDRHVMEEMRAKNATLGGEDSGHIIFLNHHTTGDGVLSALMLLSAIRKADKPLSELSKVMTVFPQTLVNVVVKAKPEITTVPTITDFIQKIEKKLGDKGRVLVRYSGTEPVCRVMVEGERQDEIEGYAAEIADSIQESLG